MAARARSTLSPHGEIEVDARGATSLPGVFAAGDATTVPVQADRHRDRRRLEGRAVGLRLPDPHHGAGGVTAAPPQTVERSDALVEA